MATGWTARIVVLLAVLAGVVAAALPALGQDGGEAFQGQIRDSQRNPIEGVEIVVVDASGTLVGSGATDEDGEWFVPVPGPGDYVVEVQTETLPEGVSLRDPDRAATELSVVTGQTRTVGFAMGAQRDGRASAWTELPQRAVQGLRFGLIIAMTAIGLSLVFGTTGLINFSHGEMVTFGAVVAFFLNVTGPGIPLLGAAALATAAGGLLGAGLERGLWRPLRHRGTGLIQMLIVSVGLTLVVRHVLLIVFGGRSRTYADYAVQAPLALGPFRVAPRDLAVMALSILVLVGVTFLLRRTRLGKAMRAVADNRDLAESSGIDVERIVLVVWVLGGALAALGGVLLGVVENVSYVMGFRLLLLMFAGVILGGLGTAFGAVVGSLVVGMVTEVSTVWLSSELKQMWALIVLVPVLLVRPQGILGVRERVG